MHYHINQCTHKASDWLILSLNITINFYGLWRIKENTVMTIIELMWKKMHFVTVYESLYVISRNAITYLSVLIACKTFAFSCKGSYYILERFFIKEHKYFFLLTLIGKQFISSVYLFSKSVKKLLYFWNVETLK